MRLVTKEEERLSQDRNRTKYWRRWGPYLGERQWATVREDYSDDGDAWSAFPFEQSHLRTYRWGEDGLAGVSDNHQLICFSMALWNENDDILKERLFGVTGEAANHGEDVKELYYYLDNTPSHSYMKYLYKYPQSKFPYEELISENRKRSRLEREYEITDSEVLKDNRYFDVIFEMAKDDEDENELYFRITAYNRGPTPAPLHVAPQVTFRNTWSWGIDEEKDHDKPIACKEYQDNNYSIRLDSWKYGSNRLVFAPSPAFSEESSDIEPKLLFTNNESNKQKLWNQKNASPYTKDAFHEYIVNEDSSAINPQQKGTKACAWFSFDENGGVPPGDYVTIRYRFTRTDSDQPVIDEEAFDKVFARRQLEADEFYWRISPLPISDELRSVQRQAFAGLLWNKQFYQFIHDYWYRGDPDSKIKPTINRANGRNKDWKHLYINDVLSLPDKWEYPFFCTWDTAFHCIPIAMIDPDYAKNQLDILTREWYMHPNGQMPAYEWNFSDVNPPVHAWATFRTYKIERKMYGRQDIPFLERVFQKLLLNFTWWVNRKDTEGKGLFEGGFLGLDNIGVFNRSEPLPTGGTLEQADSTGWMAFFSLQMLNIALELAQYNPVYEDIASKFFEHFILISDAMTVNGGTGEKSLWNDDDGFYYDAISWGESTSMQLPIRSLVGLIPLYASLTLEPELIKKFPSFTKRLDWFIKMKGNVAERNIESMSARGVGERLLLSLVSKERLVSILEKMLDENEFLSQYGIRSLSKYHEEHPFEMEVHGQNYEVKYLPGESDSGLFGGNSNWRGPIWLPVNFLIVESLQKFYLYYGSSLKVECPKGSGKYLNLAQVAEEIQHRLIHLFIRDVNGKRASNGDCDLLNEDKHFKNYVLFYEYFEGDTGRGLGAGHQTGWTALVAKWIHDTGISCRVPKTLKTDDRRPSYFLQKHGTNDEDIYPDDQDDLSQSFSPYMSTPFPGNLTRRRSGKSLLNLTTDVLDMTDEELKAHRRNLPGLSRTASLASSKSGYVSAGGASGSEVLSRKSSCSESDEIDFFNQVRDAISNYELKDDDNLSGDELESHIN
ncbi:hypothetical protein LJB42_004123 [Komagataella kurtzmanii]|nr:hypothetical protein LJB42_004123 [Komagataella kurtzmanii]